MCTVIEAQGPVATALFLGEPGLFNTTREDCIWKRGNDRDQCPDADITMTLFPAKNLHSKSKVHTHVDDSNTNESANFCCKLCRNRTNRKKMPIDYVRENRMKVNNLKNHNDTMLIRLFLIFSESKTKKLI